VEINKFLEFFALLHFILTNNFYLTHFYALFVNILKKVNLSDSKPSPTCYAPSIWFKTSSYICDGVKDCDDDSDEIGCQCPGYISFECDCYKSDDGCAGWQGCIIQSKVCDGKYDCSDKSDEEMCDCTSDIPFECDCYNSDDGCALRWGCIRQLWVYCIVQRLHSHTQNARFLTCIAVKRKGKRNYTNEVEDV